MVVEVVVEVVVELVVDAEEGVEVVLLCNLAYNRNTFFMEIKFVMKIKQLMLI